MQKTVFFRHFTVIFILTSLILPLILTTTFSLGGGISLQSEDMTTNYFLNDKSSQSQTSTPNLLPSIRNVKLQIPTLNPQQASLNMTDEFNSTLQQLLKIQQIDKLIKEQGLKGNNVIVGIIDSGISTAARQKLELITNVSFERLVDVTTSTPTVGIAEDEIGTGTQLASLISLIAPAVKFIIYKAATTTPAGDNSENVSINENEKFLLNALTDFQNYLETVNSNQGTVLIINRALNSTNTEIKKLITNLIYQKNTNVIIPAGNNPTFSDYQMHYLSILPEIITVAAFANVTTPLLGTGIGPRPNGLLGPDITSMGYQIPVLLPNATYALASGLHLPLGFIAASISMFLEQYPRATPLKIKAALLKSAQLIPTISTNVQGAGILDAAGALSLLKEKTLLAIQPKALTDYNRFFSLPVQGFNKTYAVTIIYHDDEKNSNSTVLFDNFKVSSNTIPQPLTVTFPKENPLTIINGMNIINLTVGSTSDHLMDRYEGNVTITINDESKTLSDSILVNVTLRYEGGRILLDETKSNSVFSPPKGKHGSMSIFYHALEQTLGTSMNTAINPEMGLRTTLADVTARGTTLYEALKTSFNNPLSAPHDLLIISDFATPITREDESLLRDWLAQGRPILLMIPPNIPSSSISRVNQTLNNFGISISSQLASTTQVNTRVGNSITRGDSFQFNYAGFAFSLNAELVRSSTIETILTANGLPVGVSYVEPTSDARMFILGTTTILENDFILTNIETVTEDSGTISFMTRVIDWLLEPNRIPVELTMLSTTLYLNEKATISVRPANFFIREHIKATIESPNGTYNQVLLRFDLQSKSYQGEWTPTMTGKHVLWIDVKFPGRTSNNGRFILTVDKRLFGINRELIAVVIIISTLIIIGVAYWQVRKSNIEKEQLFEEQVKVLKKRSEMQRTEAKRQLLLKTSTTEPLKTIQISKPRNVICPRCKTPAYNERARFCHKCGKEL